MEVFLKVKYILLTGLLLCLTVQLSATNKVPKLKKNQTDTCFPALVEVYVSLKKTVYLLNDQENSNDNYLFVLPVWNYTFDISKNKKYQKNLSSLLSQSIRTIEDAKVKTVDYCPNIADIYIMKGISLLYQNQYQQAYWIFDTVVTQYKFTRRWMDACLWQAHTALFQNDYEKTDSLLLELENSLDTTDVEDFVHYNIILADLLIKLHDYESALPYLLKLEQMPISKSMNIRVKFIIAQIYDKTGDHKNAIPYYQTVIKLQKSKHLMWSYARVYEHLCNRIIEEQQTQPIVDPTEIRYELEEFEPTIVESYHDSDFFDMSYPYYFNDMASMFFLDESTGLEDEGDWENGDSGEYLDDYYESHLTYEMLESIFENWDSVSVHIPKTDFSLMTDTIYLPLLEEGKEYTFPHFNSIISRFGWRRYRYHYGVDTKNQTGDSIFCVFDGIARIAKRNRTYGNVVIIRHYNGLETFYAHCSKLLVEPNQEVKAGQLIALVGNTGRSTGPHLHFETRYKGAAFNPEYMIDFEKGKLISDTLVITKETFNYRNSGSSSVSSSNTTTTSTSGSVYYRVRSGDTLSGIASKQRTTVSSIKKLNGLRSDFIREGQRLRIR